MSGHTATPWAVDPDHRPGMGWNAHVVQAADPDNRVCFMTSGPEGKINAAFIVTACNSHADLLDLAKNVGGFDDSLLQSASLHVLRGALREYRDQARAPPATLTARKVG